MVNYDEQTGEDSANALEKACNSLRGYEFKYNDLDYYFNRIELLMKAAGVKNNYTKFQALSFILPAKVEDEVKK